jgi:hypothetical protein
MQAMSDNEQVARLEKKIDDGFAEMRVEFRAVRTEMEGTGTALRSEIAGVRADGRADFRTLIAVVVAMWVATILAVVGALVAGP